MLRRTLSVLPSPCPAAASADSSRRRANAGRGKLLDPRRPRRKCRRRPRRRDDSGRRRMATATRSSRRRPTPRRSRRRRLVFVNGLGFEGWMPRLVKASGDQGRRRRDRPTASASQDHARRTAPRSPIRMPGRSVANAKLYRRQYPRRARRGRSRRRGRLRRPMQRPISARLDALEAEVKAAIAAIPPERRRIITSHDAFGYFGDGLWHDFIAPQGVSTEAEASAKDVAHDHPPDQGGEDPGGLPGKHHRSAADRADRARRPGAKIGGTLYSDALSTPEQGRGDLHRHDASQYKGIRRRPGELTLSSPPTAVPPLPSGDPHVRQDPRHRAHRLSRRRQDDAPQPHPHRAARQEITPSSSTSSARSASTTTSSSAPTRKSSR